MAQHVLVQLIDDLDGQETGDISTVQFGLDGVTYEIDLTEHNAERLRNSLAGYVDSARRVGGRVKRATTPRSAQGNGSGEASQIREWANANGFELSNRGRIPTHVIDAYREAQTRPSTPEQSAGTRNKRSRTTPRN